MNIHRKIVLKQHGSLIEKLVARIAKTHLSLVYDKIPVFIVL